jgi:hypothetical protein
MTNVENAIFDKYLTIKQDLISNIDDVFNRQHTYTHKYRGNVLTEINVSLDYGPLNEKIIQIFIRNSDKWIRDRMSIFKGGYYSSEIKSNILYNE